MMSIGRPMMSAMVRKSLALPILKPGLLMVAASSSDVVIFDISAGWNFTGPSSNQECEPFTSFDRNITSTSRTPTSTYDGMDMTSHKRGLRTKRMRAASPSEVTIQMNCLPLRAVQSKMLAGSDEWMDA